MFLIHRLPRSGFWLFFLTILALLPAGCTRQRGVVPDADEVLGDDAAIEAPATQVASVVKGHNQFAGELYGRLRSRPGNVVVSPFSVATALGMLHAGASGATADEIQSALHLTIPPDSLPAAMGALRQKLMQPQNGAAIFESANALWAQKGVAFAPGYLDTLKTAYLAPLKPVDFRSSPDEAQGIINDWISQRTRGLIPNLLEEGDVNTQTAFVLTNAFYLKTQWKHPFFPHPKKGKFAPEAGRAIDADMMSVVHYFPYVATAEFQLVELPYAKSSLSIVVVLPKSHALMAAVEKRLIAGEIDSLKTVVREVDVVLPKFTQKMRSELNRPLQELGIVRAFSLGADFSKMGVSDVFVSRVIHEAIVKVDEKGTEAAAATAIVATWSWSSDDTPPPPIPFYADRPFLYLIRDTETGCILFVGRVMEPKT